MKPYVNFQKVVHHPVYTPEWLLTNHWGVVCESYEKAKCFLDFIKYYVKLNYDHPYKEGFYTNCYDNSGNTRGVGTLTKRILRGDVDHKPQGRKILTIDYAYDSLGKNIISCNIEGYPKKMVETPTKEAMLQQIRQIENSYSVAQSILVKMEEKRKELITAYESN